MLMAACSERDVCILEQPGSRECLLLAVKRVPELGLDLEGIVRVVASSERVKERGGALTSESAETVVSCVGEALHDGRLATEDGGDGGGHAAATAAAAARDGAEEVEEGGNDGDDVGEATCVLGPPRASSGCGGRRRRRVGGSVRSGGRRVGGGVRGCRRNVRCGHNRAHTGWWRVTAIGRRVRLLLPERILASCHCSDENQSEQQRESQGGRHRSSRSLEAQPAVRGREAS